MKKSVSLRNSTVVEPVFTPLNHLRLFDLIRAGNDILITVKYKNKTETLFLPDLLDLIFEKEVSGIVFADGSSIKTDKAAY